MIKDTGRRIKHIFAACFHIIYFRLKELKKTVSYITKLGNKSPRIPYYGQWLWTWNIFKWLCVIPLLQSGLCDGRSAVTSLEHSRTDITQHLPLAFCD